jgi:hypothetical protein
MFGNLRLEFFDVFLAPTPEPGGLQPHASGSEVPHGDFEVFLSGVIKRIALRL